jgi:replicative DNA helicase
MNSLKEFDCRNDVERAILGAIILEAGAYAKVCDFLSIANFRHFHHAEIFRAITELHPGRPVDLITVNHHLRGKYAYEIANLTSSVASAANIRYHACILIEFSIRETFIKLLTNHQDQADLTTRSAIQDIISVCQIGNDLFKIIDHAIDYLGSFSVNPSFLNSIEDFRMGLAKKMHKIHEQSTVSNLIAQLEAFGHAPLDVTTRLATSKLVEILKTSLATGKLDHQVAQQLLNL